MVNKHSEANHQKPTRGAHVLLLPYPLQGHINPILQFAKRLAFQGITVTVLVPSSISHQASFLNSSVLEFVRIYDGYDEKPDKRDVEAFLNRIRASISQSLPELLDHYMSNNQNFQPTPKMIIYDSIMPWVLDLVKKYGLKGAPFFTQSCVVNSIYYHVCQGHLNRLIKGFDLVSIPSLKSLLKVDDLPSFLTSSPSPSHPIAIYNMVFDQFLNVKEANCLFVNTVDKLEIEVVNWMASICPVKTIGPCIPSKYLDNRIPDDSDYGLSLFHPETDLCIRWLNAREDRSVVYISMGSLASLGKEQMEEVAKALVKSNNYFLWVVRASEESKLPLNFKESSQKGLIVNWCPQLKVLAHPALGCFVTHCGWNSILEAISLGVPMVAIPQWTDQPTNAKCVMDFWGVGVKVKANEDGFVTREEIELCIRKVMEGESAKEIRSNAMKYKQIAKETMEEGGSSARNIEEFVTELLST